MEIKKTISSGFGGISSGLDTIAGGMEKAADKLGGINPNKINRVKGNETVAKIMSDLLNEIFEMVDNVIDLIEDILTAHPGKASRRVIVDDLNFAAMVAGYTLADTFAGILAATFTVESASINLNSNGETAIAGAKLTHACSLEDKSVQTPTTAVKENVSTVEKVANLIPKIAKYGTMAAAFIADLVPSGSTSSEDQEEL